LQTSVRGLARAVVELGNEMHVLTANVDGLERVILFGQVATPGFFAEGLWIANRVRMSPVVVTPEMGAAEIARESGGGLVVAGDPGRLARPCAR